ncbi:MAG: amino acid adenylation domain-containing protein, partial [Acidobacteriota bacterium]|nr:amino acid adenylation domain-containing protein [Acidobacteriota bacterium]
MSSGTSKLEGLSPEQLAQLIKRLRPASGATSGAGEAAPRAAEAIPRLPRDGRDFVLSTAQERLWFLHRLDRDDTAYTLCAAARLRGRLRPAALARSLRRVRERHEILRTVFVDGEDGPRQAVVEGARQDPPVVDLTALGAGPARDRAGELARRLAGQPFDLAADALLRPLLLRLGHHEHWLVLELHHIVCDAWSMGLLVRELGQLYAAEEGASGGLPQLPVQYADYAAWERSRLETPAIRQQLDEWCAELEGAPVVELAGDRPRPVLRSSRGHRAPIRVPAAQLNALRQLTEEAGTSLFVALAAAVALLLEAHGAGRDLVIGTPVANRRRSEVAGLVGFFVNTLPLRLRVRPAASFRDHLQAVGKTAGWALDRQEVPFEQMVERLVPRRGLSHPPLVQVLLALDEAPAEMALPGLGIEVDDVPNGTAKLDLLLQLRREPDGGLGGWLEASADLFDGTTAQRLARRWEGLIRRAMEASPGAVGRWSKLAVSERHCLLYEWSGRAAEGASGTLFDGFLQAARRHPEAVAVIGRETRFTYGELEARSRELALRLRQLGAGAETLVAVRMERTPAMVAALLAVLRSGAAYVPVDPAYPPERQRFLIEDSGAAWVFTDLPENPRFDAAEGGSTGLRRLVLDAQGRLVSEPAPGRAAAVSSPEPPPVPPPVLPPARPENLAYLIYTSGSTGRPKAVAIEHRQAAALLAWAARAYTAEELAVVAATTSLSFDLSIFELFAPLQAGGTVLVLRDALELAQLGQDHGAFNSVAGPTLVNTVPSALAELVQQDFRCPDLRTVNLAGEPLRGALVDRVYRLGGVDRVCNLYGPSEDTTYSTWSVVSRRGGERGTAGEPTIGRPVDGGRAYVVDGALQLLPLGVPGEIVLAGAGLARGYFRRPRATAEGFVPDPAGDGGRLYRTGDLGRFLADGRLEYLGRRDQQIKLRGFRIELGEIEVALGALPQVAEAAVVAVGELAQRRLVAFVSGARGVSWTPEALSAELRARLPEPLVPSELRSLDALPLTANGKIDRRELRRLASEDIGRDEAGSPYRAPRSPLEGVLVTLYQELLERPKVGIDDSFFALGGQSLLAARLASRLAQALEREVPVPWIFEAPTVAQLAERIDGEGRRRLPELRPGARPPRLPLSPAQERLWFLDRLQPGQAVYHLPMALDLDGDLDPGALEQALLEVMDRHEALRTFFLEAADGAPEQRVMPVPERCLTVVDLRGTSDRPPAWWRVLETRWARRPFELSRDLPLRAVLLHRAESSYSLCLVAHHIAVDGGALAVLFDELAEVYGALVHQRPALLPEVPLQVADHALWQRMILDDEMLGALLENAKERLAGAPAALDLPFDGPPPAISGHRGETLPVPLPPATGERLRSLARECRATPFAVLAAVLETALWRWTGQTDLVFGTPVAQRERPELQRAVGLYVNTLVLRTGVRPGAALREQVAAAGRSFLAAYAGRDLPFEELVRELGDRWDLGSSPIFQVLLVLQQEIPRPRFAGLRASLRPLDTGAARFDLTLAAAFRDDALEMTLELSADRFEATTRRRLAGQLGCLLQAALEAPDASLEALSPLTAAQRHQLLVEWQHRPELTAGASETDLWSAFAARAVMRPEATAVRWRGENWSYGRLAALATGWSLELRALGVGPEEVVAVAARRTPQTLAALLGVLRAGAVYLPLDPEYPPARLQTMLEDSGARGAICDAHLEPVCRAAGVATVSLDTVAAPEPVSPESPLPDADAPAIDPRQLAYLIYTSGSTGRPKAVAIEHRSALALVRWSRQAFADEELAGVLAVTSLCFDLSVFEVFVTLCRGGTVVLVDNALALAELGTETRVTLVNTVPSALAAVLALGRLPDSIGTVNLAGEPLRRDLVRSLQAASAVRRVWNLYGPSEDTTYSTAAPVPLADDREPTIGRAIGGTQARVLHAARRPAPVGVVGELCLSGDGLARGYLGRPGRTAESFVPDPFSPRPGGRLYRTGDLARWGVDGELHFLGRRDHQVKLRGFRVELTEIEAALSRMPEVEEAAVLARPGLGEEAQLVAYVGCSRASVEAGDLGRRLASQLPPALVPAHFVVLERLPHTPNGKIDRGALPAPDLATGSSAGEGPRTAEEEILVGLFEQALDRSPIAPEDDFFALGGHSLLAVRLLARIREVFGVTLPVRTVFEHPTVRGVAARLGEARREPAEQTPLAGSTASNPAPNPAPASWIQQRLWFLESLGAEPGAYAMPLALDLDGELDAAALEAALARVVRRHEILRTVLSSRDGVPQQLVLERVPVRLPRVDLGALASMDRGALLEQLLRRLVHARFDLATGPLFRMLLVRTGARRHRLLLAAHHAVFDGWSGSILLREVGAGYRAELAVVEEAALEASSETRAEPGLTPLPLQYADFALWQRRQEARHRQGLDFYRRQLAGAPPVLDLPVDRLRAGSERPAGGLESLRLEAEPSARLLSLCRERAVTPFLLLTTAWAVVLSRWSGQPDVVLGAPVSVRDHQALEDLIGPFLNTLVLRVELEAGVTFAALLERVRERFLAAYEYRDLPFEKLLEELEVERSLERTPIFQVFVNMLSFPAQTLDLPGLTVSLPEPPSPPPKFDLTLYARVVAEKLELDLVYDSTRFAAPTMAELLRQLSGVLEQAAERPEAPVLSLSLRTAHARQLLPDPTEPLPRTWRGPVHRLFAEWAGNAPRRPAVIEDGGESWTYGELAQVVEAVAATLAEHGAGLGERVLIYAHRSAALVAAIVGTLRSGAAFSIVDPAYPASRLVAAAERVQPRVLLALEAAGAVPLELGQALERAGVGQIDLAPGRAELLATLSRGEAAKPDLGPDSPAYVGLTSGSTGLPKGVLGRHGSLTHFTPWMSRRFGLGDQDRFSLLASIAHDPLHRDVFTPLQLGAVLEIPRAERFAEPGYLARWLARREVTICHLTPAMVRLLAEGAEGVEAPSLRRVFLVGEALTREHVRRLHALGPAVHCVNLYGSTETQRAVAYFPVSEGPVSEGPVSEGKEEPGSEVLPLGRGMEGVQLLVEAAGGQGLAGIGELGEISVRSPHVALGYFGDDLLTAERFVINEHTGEAGDRVYRTGDLGRYRADGNVVFAGRRDQQVKIRGFRVELEEIEAALEAQPGVRDAAVALWPPEVAAGGAGEGRAAEPLLAAYVVPAGEALDFGELRAALGRRLPEHMVPAVFEPLAALPLTANRKLDRGALPRPERTVEVGREELPQGEMERRLAALWGEVLGLESVPRDTSFFALGGHSLGLTRLSARITAELGVQVPLRELFEHNTLAAQALRLAAAGVGSPAPGSQAPESPPPGPPPFGSREQTGPAPLSFAQQRLWFLDQLNPGSAAFNLAFSFRLRGALRRPALEGALRDLVHRHGALRTRFSNLQGTPHQELGGVPARPLPVIDLSALGDGAEAVQELLSEAVARRPFDLERGPLLRAVLLLRSATEHVTVVCLHHIVSDGWSNGVLVRELGELYRARVENRSPNLPQLPFDYGDFAAWQRSWLAGEGLERELDAWRRQLRGWPQELELPADRPRPEAASLRGRTEHFELQAPLDGLQELAREADTTLFVVLMAAFQVLLHHLTGEIRLLVGTDVANRRLQELEGMVGF